MSARVLIVDDSLTVRMDLTEAFRDAGFDAVPCGSALEAREALAGELPALLVLDVVLPDADGVDLLKELRARQETAALPVIMLSGETEVRDRIRGLKQGASAYVGKPYDADYVVARATEILRATSSEPTRDASPIVLLIDDSPTYRHALSEELTAAGYTPYAAGSGPEGLRRAAELRPAAILVDGVMPEMDGTAVVRRIRLDPGLAATPCILLTASEGGASEVVALEAGADAYVQKGDGIDLILARLSAVLRAAAESQRAAPASTLMGPKRILAVDDSPTYLQALSDELRDGGYEVIKAHSGEEALELLAIEHVDCILLDRRMPGLSGIETCRRIKASPVLRNVPLIMLTAVEEPDAVVEGMNAGADDYVVKSASFRIIRARLRAQLRRKQLEDESRRVRERFLLSENEARAARETAEARAVLLRELADKNRDLEALYAELRLFAYSVSHDLRQPLRSMDGFSRELLDRYGAELDETGRHYLTRVRAGAQRMGELIDGLLMLSRVAQKELRYGPLRLDAIADAVFDRLRDAESGREVRIDIARPLPAVGDRQLIESAFENLIGNAWKFTHGRERPRIEIGVESSDQARVYYVRDNGAGFDMDYADKLFAPFQRLHAQSEYPGTGLGLATTARIIHRHGGRIWADGNPGQGATFFFTLGVSRPAEVSW